MRVAVWAFLIHNSVNGRSQNHCNQTLREKSALTGWVPGADLRLSPGRCPEQEIPLRNGQVRILSRSSSLTQNSTVPFFLRRLRREQWQIIFYEIFITIVPFIIPSNSKELCSLKYTKTMERKEMNGDDSNATDFLICYTSY